MNENTAPLTRRIATGITLLAIALLAAVPTAVNAQVRAYFFYGNGCPHCAKERAFLDAFEAEQPTLSVAAFEVYEHTENVELLLRAAEALNTSVDGVPFLIIGDRVFSGFAEGVTDRAIRERVAACANGSCSDSIAAIVGLPPINRANETAAPFIGEETADPAPEPTPMPQKETAAEIIEALSPEEKERGSAAEPFAMPAAEAGQDADGDPAAGGDAAASFSIPLLGSFDASSVSLPLLTVVMGFLDGFNPCAMWTLLFLISLLLGMGDRRKMWILGSAFIAASAAVYLLFMAAWLKLVLFLGVVGWIRIAIGVVALVGGAYSLKTFFTNKDGGCEVAGEEGRQKLFERMRAIVRQGNLWFALGGIILLAFAVNTIELVCSAGFPAVYTQVLALRQLGAWHYAAYLLLYIFFFMLDDLFVFIAAMVTLEMTGVTTKYVRASRLVGGILLAVIGILLIFKPSWLLF